MRFWFARGVDGFRMDASAVLIKDRLLRDNPPNPESKGKPPPQRYKPVFTDDRPETMHCIEFIRSVVDEHRGKLLCGEVQGKTDRIGHFYGSERPRLHLPLNFALLDSSWDALSLQATIDAYYNALPKGAWPVWVIGGHDKPRVASKIGRNRMRVLAMLLLTLKGTPFFFMGDELGRERVSIPADRVEDPFEMLVPGYDLCRDPERAPMRWDASPNGSFTSGEPWLPLEKDVTRNVEEQKSDGASLLHLFHKLISLRRKHSCLRNGEYEALRSTNDVLTFKRVWEDRALLIGLNISSEPRKWECSCTGRILMSTHQERQRESIPSLPVLLCGNEGLIIEVD
jgi:alpha-glucosidase